MPGVIRVAMSSFPLVVMALMGPSSTAQNPPPAAPQEPAAPAPVPSRPEIRVVAPTLREAPLFDSPRSVSVITRDDIEERMLSRTLPDALRETPGVSVQKTSAGHGSPFIRGFTGFRNVLLIDGIRLNNSGFREGPNQYWNTVDEFLIERMEVVRGPASVLYGSDAMGGTVAVSTRDLLAIGEPGAGGRTFYRYGSADASQTVRQEGWHRGEGFAVQAGGTFRDFNDLSGGRHTGTQPETGYDEYDADAKLMIGTPDAHWVVALQHNRQDDVPRTHRTLFAKEFHGSQVGTDRQLNFNQQRNLAYVQYHARDLGGAIDTFSASLAIHRHLESSHRTLASGAQEIRESSIAQPSLWVRFGSDTAVGRLTYGADWYRDYVQSDGRNKSAAGAVTWFRRGEIPDDTTVDHAGVYVQDEIAVSDDFDLTAGLRQNFVAVDARDVDASAVDDPATPDRFDDEYAALVGNLRGVWHADEGWNVIAGWGMGFRAPTLDDSLATRVVQSGNTDLSSPGLDPEYTHTVEVGTRLDRERWRAGGFLYYTRLHDFISRVSVGDVTGDGRTDFVKRNLAEGEVKGLELEGGVDVTREVSLFTDAAWALGDVQTIVNGRRAMRPLSKVNPAMLHLGARWKPEGSAFWLEGLVTSARVQDRLSPSDETDLQRIPYGGTPGYTIYTLRLGYRFSEAFRASLALENITDKDYRAHGSGQNEAGTNAVIGVEARY